MHIKKVLSQLLSQVFALFAQYKYSFVVSNVHLCQSGEAFLTDKEREMQRKSQLFESSIHLLSSLGFAKSELDTATKCDPVRDSVLSV